MPATSRWYLSSRSSSLMSKATSAFAFMSHARSSPFHFVGDGIGRTRMPITSEYRLPSGIAFRSSRNSIQCSFSRYRSTPYSCRNAARISPASCTKSVTFLLSVFGGFSNSSARTAASTFDTLRGCRVRHFNARYSLASGMRSSRAMISIIFRTFLKSKSSR